LRFALTARLACCLARGDFDLQRAWAIISISQPVVVLTMTADPLRHFWHPVAIAEEFEG